MKKARTWLWILAAASFALAAWLALPFPEPRSRAPGALPHAPTEEAQAGSAGSAAG